MNRPWIADEVQSWIPWIRVAAAPFVLLEVAIERGNYPSGWEPWAWAIAATFAGGSLALLALARADHRVAPAAGLVFDLAVLSAFVAVYSFELGTPVRQVLFLPVVEAAVLYGRRGGVGMPFATAPALAFFEWKQSDAAGAPYDPGHILGPVGIALLVGLIVGTLAQRRGVD